MIGKTISHYRIIEQIGQGGMGVVYKAEDTKLKRTVALKFLSTTLGGEEEKMRFFREALSAAALQHPNICTVYEIDEDDGQTFIAMEYIDGQNLKDIIRQGPMPIDRALHAAIQAGLALQEAHDNDIIHRDIKSANVMLTAKGRAIVLDFGLAKQSGQTAITQLGTSMGTIDFMSPEQAKGDEVDHRTDIWSFGVMLYEMVTGRVPFIAEREQAVIYSILNNEPDPMSALRTGVSAELERIVKKILVKNPKERYQSMADVLVDLHALQREVGVPSGVTAAVTPDTSPGAARGKESLWSHLTNRRVPHTLGIYALASFGIVSLMQWLVNRFPLSPHLPDFTFATLASLVPAVLLIAYFRGRSGARGWGRVGKIGIPLNLVASAFLLFFVFQDKDLGATTTNVLVRDENGNLIERAIPKGEFRKRIATFYFDNKTGDESLDWFQYGILHLLRTDMLQDTFIAIGMGFTRRHMESGFALAVGSPLTLKKNVAREFHFPYFLAGSFDKQGNTFKLDVSLYDSKNGKVIANYNLASDDVFAMVDSLSIQVRRGVGLPAYHIESTQDLPVAEMMTDSFDALEHYVRGVNFRVQDNDYTAAMKSLRHAVDLDPAFAYAYWQLYNTYVGLNYGDGALKAIRSALKHKYRLPEQVQFSLKNDYYEANQDMDAKFENAKRWAAFFPEATGAHVTLAQIYENRNDLDTAIAKRTLVYELDPERHFELHRIADLYADQGKTEEALAYFQQYADLFPDNYESYTRIGGFYADRGNFKQARGYYKQAQVIEPEEMFIRTRIAEFDRHMGDFDGALKQCLEALEYARTPQDSTTVFLALQRHHGFRGQAKQALEYLEQSFVEREKYQSPVSLQIARVFSAGEYALAGEVERAYQMLRDIEARPTMPWMADNVTAGYLIAYMYLNDPSNAPDTEKRLDVFKNFVNAMGLEDIRWAVNSIEANLHRWRGEDDAALESARLAVEQAPKDDPEQVIQLNVHAGICAANVGDYPLAEEYFKNALELEPFDPMAHFGLARLYHEMGETDKVIKHIEKALEVWKDADAEHPYAKRAREFAKELKTSS